MNKEFTDDVLMCYRKFTNGVDDYFEYRNESDTDRAVVKEMLNRLNSELQSVLDDYTEDK